ncbi:Nitrogen permease regulator 2, partial [Quaeritorhiza haematococci]
MDTFQGFPLLLAIFFSEFHPTQGPKVVFEVPEGFVSQASAATATSTSNPPPNPTVSSPRPPQPQQPQQQPPANSTPSLTPLSHSQHHHHIQTPKASPLGVTPSTSNPTTSTTTTTTTTTAAPTTSPLIVPTKPSGTSGPTPFSAPYSTEPLLDFDSMSEYIIPKPELCNRLVTISTPAYKVVGYPVLIEDE